MTPTQEGSVRLFRFSGINVFIHWSWFLVAFWAVENRKYAYASPIWNLIEYLGLFAVVLLHEFGHSFATRQVGGHSDTIVLWPFGGVAYVRAPERAGATLWSIAAGPLVNVVLVAILWPLNLMFGPQIAQLSVDLYRFVIAMLYINIGLLIFNLLPVYPLDGGQILRSLLWFRLGRVKSLHVATIIGFIGVAVLGFYAVKGQNWWLVIMTVFIFMNCRQGWQQARALSQIEALPRHNGYSCPECHSTPPAGENWRCGKCGSGFDPFANNGACRHCGSQYSVALCPSCGAWSRLEEWRKPPVVNVDASSRRG